MKPANSPAERLARMVARTSELAPPTSALADARSRFLESAATPRRPHRRLYLGLAAVCALAVILLVVGLRPRALSFVVGNPPVARTVGDWVAAGDSSVGVSFSDGSVLTLVSGARARVTRTSAEGAEVLIERGAVDAVIAHAHGPRDWSFRAGPFRIHVTGTAFRADWNPNDEVLEVDMREGVVVVEGPLLPPNRTVAAGERLVVSVRQNRMALSAGTETPASPAPLPSDVPGTPVGAPAAPTCSARASAERVPVPTTASPGVSSEAADDAESWRDLAKKGKHKEAMSAMSDDQFASLVASAGPAALLSLADTARLGGRADRAKSALLQARARGAHGQSAFLLGKIAADQLGAPGDAITWFETYLTEEPNGPLAEQSLGRILELERHGAPETARATASRYLARFPNGAYADLARSLVGNE